MPDEQPLRGVASHLGTIGMSVNRLKTLLLRVAQGEDPDFVLMEELANAHQGSIREWATEWEEQQRRDHA